MSSLESYDYHPSVAEMNLPPYLKLLEEIPSKTFADRKLDYDVLCLAMENPVTGGAVIVGKAHEEDSAKPRDWVAYRFNPSTGELVEDVVLGVHISHKENGDNIELELAPDVYHHGPYYLNFNVDKNYRQTGQAATLTHKKYYGHGYDPSNVEYQDAVYTNSLINKKEELAPVISIEEARKARAEKLAGNFGHSAVAGS